MHSPFVQRPSTFLQGGGSASEQSCPSLIGEVTQSPFWHLPDEQSPKSQAAFSFCGVALH
jgi:hypothetical protein